MGGLPHPAAAKAIAEAASESIEVMYAGEDGWSEWIHPLPGYRMKCCGCGLVHEMQFAIAAPVEEPAPAFNDGEGPEEVIVFRARRSKQ